MLKHVEIIAVTAGIFGNLIVFHAAFEGFLKERSHENPS